MAGYPSEAARPHVLAFLATSCPVDAAHLPQDYDVLVAASEVERWARVTCSCGQVSQVDWQPGSTASYREALVQAWMARTCAG
jgi:hypothetical protein